MEIYFDNSATTKTAQCVNEIMLEVLQSGWGNPSSLHNIGMTAEKYIKKSAKIIADEIGAAPEEIYFTSGGTESDNIAVLGYANANRKRGMHAVTTSIEHPAAAECFKELERTGFEVDYLSVDSKGNIDLSELESVLREDTVLVSVMHVNNEVGSINPIEKIKPIMKRKSPKAVLHCDAVQSFMKEDISVSKWGIDLLSVSGHKIHGPKGIGALYIKKGTIIKPVIFGGHQQKNMRSGTENVFAAAGMGRAVEFMKSCDKKEIAEIKNGIYKGIMSKVENCVLNGSEEGSSHILNISFLGVRSEILLHSLEAKGIYVSAGSACSSNKPSPSVTLTQMKKSAKEIDSAIRFSFGALNSTDEIEYTVNTVAEEVSNIRKYVRA